MRANNTKRLKMRALDHTIQDGVTHVTLGSDFNPAPGISMFPNSVTHVTFRGDFNSRISEGVLPPRLRELVFGDGFNQSFIVPEGVERVTFGRDFGQMLDHINIPQSVTHIYLHSDYQRSLDDVPDSVYFIFVGDRVVRGDVEIIGTKDIIPDSTAHISISGDMEFTTIPPSVRSLYFFTVYGTSFRSQILSNTIPNTVKKITFSCSYTYPLETGVLPEGLTHLYLTGNNYDYDNMVIPSSVRYLTIGYLPPTPIRYPPNLFSLTIEKSERPLVMDDIPRTIKQLIFGDDFDQPIYEGLSPEGLTHLTVGNRLDQPLSRGLIPRTLRYINTGRTQSLDKDADPAELFPRSLKYLTVNKISSYNIPPWVTHLKVRRDITMGEDMIPGGIVSLKLPARVGGTIEPGMLPEGIEYLDLGGANQDYPRGVIPNGVRHLKFGPRQDHPVVIPDGVETLLLGKMYDHPLVIPNSVRDLYFGNAFNQPIQPGDLPTGLKTLIFGSDFDQPLSPGVLPETLIEVQFGKEFNQTLTEGVLPSGLKRLIMIPEPVFYNSIFPYRRIYSTETRRIASEIIFREGVLPPGLTHIYLDWTNNISSTSVIPRSVIAMFPGRDIRSSFLSRPARGGLLVTNLPATRPIPRRSEPRVSVPKGCPILRREKRESDEIELCKTTLKPLPSNSDVFRESLNALVNRCNEMETEIQPGYLSTVRAYLDSDIQRSNIISISAKNDNEFISAIKVKDGIFRKIDYIRVSYANRDAIDVGGLRRTFMTTLMETMRDVLFSPLRGQSQRYYITSHSDERILGSIGHLKTSFTGSYTYKHVERETIGNIPYTFENGDMTIIIPNHGLDVGDFVTIKSMFTEVFEREVKIPIVTVIDENTLFMRTGIQLEDDEGVIEEEFLGENLKIVVSERVSVDVTLDGPESLPREMSRVYMNVLSGRMTSNMYDAEVIGRDRIRITLSGKLDDDVSGRCVVGVVDSQNETVNINSVYYTAGVLFAFSIYNSINTHIPVCRYLLRCMLGGEVSEDEKMLYYLLDMSETIGHSNVLGGYQQFDTEYLREEAEALDDNFGEYLISNPGASDDVVRKKAFEILESGFRNNASEAYSTTRLSSLLDGFRKSISMIIDKYYLSPTELFDLVYQPDLDAERMREFLNRVDMEKMGYTRSKLTAVEKDQLIEKIIIPMGPEYYSKLLVFMSGQSTIIRDQQYKIIIRSVDEPNPVIKGETCFQNLILPAAFVNPTEDVSQLIAIMKEVISDRDFNAT